MASVSVPGPVPGFVPGGAGVEQPGVSPGGARGDARSIELRDLVDMSLLDLTDLYRAGTVPESLRELDDAVSGRLLALRGLDWRGAHGLFAAVAGSRFFPWAGKRFLHLDRNAGTGINRMRLAGERLWYPFRTSVEPSVIDGAPCIVLDYARPENPPVIRSLRDELREVSPGLFMGPALLRLLGKPRLVLFFACDSRPALVS
jgi:hypothetical protein